MAAALVCATSNSPNVKAMAKSPPDVIFCAAVAQMRTAGECARGALERKGFDQALLVIFIRFTALNNARASRHNSIIKAANSAGADGLPEMSRASPAPP